MMHILIANTYSTLSTGLISFNLQVNLTRWIMVLTSISS